MRDDRLLTPGQTCWRVALMPLLQLVQARAHPVILVVAIGLGWRRRHHLGWWSAHPKANVVRPAIGAGISMWRYSGFTTVGAAFVQLADRPARLRVAHAA